MPVLDMCPRVHPCQGRRGNVHERFIAGRAPATAPVEKNGRKTHRDIAETMNRFNHPQGNERPNELQSSIFGVSFYPYMVVIEKLSHPRHTLSGSIFQGLSPPHG